MIIIIDGYNLLKKIFPHVSGRLDAQKNLLIKHLGVYCRLKQSEIREIILVFDGGVFGHASREVKQGVVIIHSGQKNSADEWIFEAVKKRKGQELLLVSLDRELKELCKPYGVLAIAVDDFYQKMLTFLSQQQEKKIKNVIEISPDLQKYKHEDIDDDSAGDSGLLDMLMENATVKIPVKNDKQKVTTRVSSGNKQSKESRVFDKILKKIT